MNSSCDPLETTDLMLHLLQERLQQLCLLGQGRLLAWWGKECVSIFSVLVLNVSPDGRLVSASGRVGVQVGVYVGAECKLPLCLD